MDFENKATQIRLLDLRSPQIRAFHMSWFAFFLCFMAWFGMTPLMKVVSEELSLTREQVCWCVIGSVAMTIPARLLVGWLCDRIGPRLTYSGLLLTGSLPVMGIGMAHDFTTFLMFRVAIGVIGASFVVTQYHTSIMFAPNCVGTANATTAGWGNLGGGVTQLAMPLVMAMFVGLGLSTADGWRAAMFVAGAACGLTGIAYYLLTQDAPAGNFASLRAQGLMPHPDPMRGSFLAACRDHRAWALFVVYGACFGVELTMINIAALYFADYFGSFQSTDSLQAMGAAGLIASSFGLVNIFARTLGGMLGDRIGQRGGLAGRVTWLFVLLFWEGLALMLVSRTSVLSLAAPTLLLFSLLVQMSEGATFAIVPFINRRALGSVAGIVGAGGNAGAVAAGFLFKSPALSWPTALFVLGAIVTCCSFVTFAIGFSEAEETDARTSGLADVDEIGAHPPLPQSQLAGV